MTVGKEARMPHSGCHLPPVTWEELEAIFEDLAATNEERETALRLLDLTRTLQPYLSPLDLMREILCITLVLPSENDRPPRRPALPSEFVNWR
jgi:hypothetical protein